MTEFRRGTNYNRRMATPAPAASSIAAAGTAPLIRQTFARGDCQDCGKPLASGSHGECVEPVEASCTHALLDVVLNASDEPVRLICQCGREWRVLPVELKVTVVPDA